MQNMRYNKEISFTKAVKKRSANAHHAGHLQHK